MSKKLKEPITLKIKKKWLRSKPTTFLIVLILIAAFIALNLWIQSIDLAQIDVTENKVYSLTEASKKEIKNIETDVKIYAYGYSEDSSVVDLIKQYCKENEHITYEILTEESNKNKVEEYDLESGYSIVIVEVGETSTLLDGGSDFNSYDYTTGQEVDLTEQSITNAILNLTVKDKPKAYILSGHGEYTEKELGVLTTYLKNEAYEYSSLNLLNVDKIPEDCNVLLILSPTTDFLENETNMILDYINKGGNIVFAKDTEENGKSYPNLQKILDYYGLKIINGYVYESNSSAAVSGYPNIIMPSISSYSEVTSDIYSDGGYLLFAYAQKIEKADDETAENLGVEYETLLTSSENSYYITDVSSNISTAISTAEKQSVDLAVVATKTIESESEEENNTKSKILVIGNGNFITDSIISVINTTYPISYIGNNKDFMLNSIAYLTNRTDNLTIRKEMNTSTYTPTQTQDNIVKLIIFVIPILIIITGIIVWNKRKRKR